MRCFYPVQLCVLVVSVLLSIQADIRDNRAHESCTSPFTFLLWERIDGRECVCFFVFFKCQDLISATSLFLSLSKFNVCLLCPALSLLDTFTTPGMVVVHFAAVFSLFECLNVSDRNGDLIFVWLLLISMLTSHIMYSQCYSVIKRIIYLLSDILIRTVN